MSDEFGNLAQIAAAALVSAMVTDSWEAVKGRFAIVARRDRQLDATQRELATRSGSALEQAKSAQTHAWTDILQDILDDDPGKAQALQDFLGYLRLSPQAVPRSQSQRASHGGVSIGGNNTGDIATDGSRIDKRRYRFFLPPVFFGHALKAAATHWVVSTVTVVVVVGGVTTGVALTHKGANTPAPTPTASHVVTPTHSAAPLSQSSVNWGALQGGPARTGAQPDEARIGAANVSKLSQVRTYKTNFGSTAPLIANGILYVATNQLYAFNAAGGSSCSAAPSTCTPLWTAPVAYIHGMAVADGRVYVTDNEGVQAFDAAGSENCSGTPKVCAPLWATATNTNTSTGRAFEPGPGSPVVANGVLFINVTGNDTVYAYSL
jgi:PQQ-like domain